MHPKYLRNIVLTDVNILKPRVCAISRLPDRPMRSEALYRVSCSQSSQPPAISQPCTPAPFATLYQCQTVLYSVVGT